jgi:hypothetical protein
MQFLGLPARTDALSSRRRLPPDFDPVVRFLIKDARLFRKCLACLFGHRQFPSATLRAGIGEPEGLVMMRATAVALAILGSFDFFAFGGKYTAVVVQMLAAIEHSFV